MKDAVGRVWTFLDQLADNDPAEYKKFIKKAMEERKEYLEPPRPAFCFSTGIRGVSCCRISPSKLEFFVSNIYRVFSPRFHRKRIVRCT